MPEIKSLHGASPPPRALTAASPCATLSADWTPGDEGRLAALTQAFKDHVDQLFADAERYRTTGEESNRRARDDGHFGRGRAPPARGARSVRRRPRSAPKRYVRVRSLCGAKATA